MKFEDPEVKETSMKQDQTLVLKGKRTKRQRPMSPFVLTMATTSSSCSITDGDDGGFCDLGLSSAGGGGGYRLTASPSNSGEFTQSTVEEEDMANCLILLAQGRRHQSQQPPQPPHPPVIPANIAKAIADVYECKTCNRRFPSFQALGGHRAGHKKPKAAHEEKKAMENFQENTALSLRIASSGRDSCSTTNHNKFRVHECSLCGAEFTSGQALGGHMRRHRPLPVAAARASSQDDSQHVKKARLELLGLDLNLPAPEDESLESKFSFESKGQVPMFATSPLVDCQY